MRRDRVLVGLRLQLFQPQLQLLDLLLQLLRLAPELHPLQLGNQQLQMLDLILARKQPLLGGNPFLVFRHQQCLQRFRREKVQIRKRRG